MTILRDPMSLHGVVERAIAQAGGLADAAIITGLPEKRLRDSTNPYLEGRHAVDTSYKTVRALTHSGVRVFADDLAAMLGLQLVPVARAASAPEPDVQAQVGNALRETGEAVTAIMAGLADGAMTPNERALASREIIDAIGAFQALLVKLNHAGGA